MTLKISIETDNTAFDDNPATEIARILRETASKVEYGTLPPFSLYDSNGNKVGYVKEV